MASSSQALPGADRIRSLKDEDAVFQAFDSYPWKKDPMFMVSCSSNSPQKGIHHDISHNRP